MNSQLSIRSSVCMLLVLLAGEMFAADDDRSYIYTRPVAEILGSTHVSGRYYFGATDFLNEGAGRLLELGMGGFKGWLTPGFREAYPFNSAWPETVESLVELVRTPHYVALLNQPFTAYSFVVGEFQRVDWKRGVSPAQRRSIEREFYELSRYLLLRYRNTGKTFILQNWEGDNALRAWAIDDPADYEIARRGMIEWLNARQDGILRARREVGMEGVKVVGAVEITRTPVGRRPFDHPLVIDDVVPHTYADLYAFSTWGTRLPGDEKLLFDQLEYMAGKAPASELYCRQNLMMGEFGAYELTYTHPENSYVEFQAEVTPGLFNDASATGQLIANRKQLEYALQWGVRYAFYWELYCNGFRDDLDRKTLQRDARGYTVASAEQLKGVWLIRPDGSKVPTYHYFANLIRSGYVADSLRDWSRVRARSEFLQRPVYSAADRLSGALVGNSEDRVASLLYEVPQLHFAAVRVFHAAAFDPAQLRVWGSADEETWVSLPTVYAAGPEVADSGWRYGYMQTSSAFDDQPLLRYLRVDLPPASAEFVRLSKVIAEGSGVAADPNRVHYRFNELDGLLVDGSLVAGFDPAVARYQWRVVGDRVPDLSYLAADPRIAVRVRAAASIPGTTVLQIRFAGEQPRFYAVDWVR